MGALNFTKVINLTEDTNNPEPILVKNLCIAQEPSAEIVQYYIYANHAEDKASSVSLGNYNDLVWKQPETRLTCAPVKRIGIKTFPGIGAYGYFRYKNEDRCSILAPINNSRLYSQAPTLAAQINNGVAITITGAYSYYRVVLRNEKFAYEYITYDLTDTLPLPEVTGTYDVYCVGYQEEGEICSLDSNHLTLSITGIKEAWIVSNPYYTKEEINALLNP